MAMTGLQKLATSKQIINEHRFINFKKILYQILKFIIMESSWEFLIVN